MDLLTTQLGKYLLHFFFTRKFIAVHLLPEIYKLVLPVIGKEAMVSAVKRMMELQRS